MTDMPHDAQHEEEMLLLDALDGDPDAVARVAADARLSARFAEMTAHRDALRTAAVVIDPGVRTSSITAAMGVFDDMAASAAASSEVAALSTRRRSRRLFRSAGVFAASAAAVVGIVAIGPNLGGSGGDDTTADVATAANDASEESDGAQPSSAPAEARAATTAAPQTTIAASFDATTTTLGAPESDAAAADAAESEAGADSSLEAPLMIDPRLAECATVAVAAAPDLLDTATWLSTTPVEGLDPEAVAQQWVIQLDSGFELDVLYAPETCEFFEISDPRVPGAE